MARPKKQKHEKRSAQIPPIRVTEAEFAHLQFQSNAAQCTLSDYVRQKALKGRVKLPKNKPTHDLILELNSIGVNMNQIARALNRGRGVPSHFEQLQAQLSATLEKVMTRHDS